MERREFLRAAGSTTGALLVTGEVAGSETYPQPVDGSEAYEPKIKTLKYPLAGVPAIVEPNDTLRVELDADDVSGVSARLEPSFGETNKSFDLELVRKLGRTDSTIWTDDAAQPRIFSVLEFDVPPVTRSGFTPDLYDLHVSWDGGSDHQPRAVRAFQSFPTEPKIAVIADPQIGDSRAITTGAEESGNKQSLDPLVTRTRRTTGDGTADSRWNATQTAIDEVNLLDPDIVLIAGDLTLGQDVPGKYYAEYEEAWRIVNEIRAPTYTILGNHDGYVQSGVDGKELYRETFSPFYYSVDISDDLHLVSLDTYDWNALNRQGVGVTVSTYGGQVRDTQYEWLERDLQPWVDGDDGSVLVLGHHNPSWQWDGEYEPADRTRGTPGAEQFGRGTRFFTTGQAWTGRRHHFDLRELFDDADVSAFFSGHSHRDRLSRSIPGDGPTDIVETPGPHTPNDGRYHYIEYADRDGDGRPEGELDNGDRTQVELAGLLEDGPGTLYVNCTTTGSSTNQYWGYRPLSVQTATGDVTLDSEEFGYETTGAFLEDRAVSPDAWNPDHSEVGLYSHPSYLLDVETVERTPKRTTVRIENDLANPTSGATVLSVGDCDGVTVSGGKKVWTRQDGTTTDVKVRFEVPAGDSGTATRTVTAECRSK